MNIPKQLRVPDMPTTKYADMTIEEAIKRLEQLYFEFCPKEDEDMNVIGSDDDRLDCIALDMAIDALKYQQSYYNQLVDYKQIADNIG